jgi:BirA family biotin operon repressor/biotin-[acetyl-CoA-carboxylase] ligase
LPIQLETVAETGSTNADLLARLGAGEPVPEGLWRVADRQTAGKGRQGRRWLDAPGNYMGSTAVHLTPHDPAAATLSFVAALAVYEAVLPRVPQPQGLQLKWPNDVLLGGAKLCGILLEREGEHAVIGIGVNLSDAPLIENRATDSLAAHGPAPSRDLFASELARSFDMELGRWRQFGLEPILARWLAAAHPLGTKLTIHDSAGNGISGAFAGLQADGALRLGLAEGTTRVIHAGDVTLGT